MERSVLGKTIEHLLSDDMVDNLEMWGPAVIKAMIKEQAQSEPAYGTDELEEWRRKRFLVIAQIQDEDRAEEALPRLRDRKREMKKGH